MLRTVASVGSKEQANPGLPSLQQGPVGTNQVLLFQGHVTRGQHGMLSLSFLSVTGVNNSIYIIIDILRFLRWKNAIKQMKCLAACQVQMADTLKLTNNINNVINKNISIIILELYTRECVLGSLNS